jgi:uncharacterized protein (DUF433 family)
MANNVIHDRGRGPEIAGTRITVYNLLPHFLDASATEADICRLYELTPQQVAAARAYVLSNPDTVLAQHLQIEAKMAAGNPPELIERAKQTHATFRSFKDWLDKRKQAEAPEESASSTGRNDSARLPTFREWFAEHEPRPEKGS